MDPKRLELFLPGQFVDPSGLARVGPGGPGAVLPNEAEIVRGILGPGAVVAMTPPPAFTDHVYVYATHELLLGYLPEIAELAELVGETETPETLIARVNEIPFEPAMWFVASLQKALAFGRIDPQHQRQLGHAIYGYPLGHACEAFLSEHERGAVISEQQLFALQRLLVLHASEDPADDLTDDHLRTLKLVLFYVPGVLLGPQDDLEEAPSAVDDERWLRYFVGHGGFAAHGHLAHDIARANMLYNRIARSRLARTENYCPLQQWLLDEYGMTFMELEAFGFTLFVGAQMNQETPPISVTSDYFDTTRFQGRTEQGFKAFAADRDWYRNEFLRSTETPRRIAFETHPFLRRPGLRISNGSVLIVAPRAVQAWLSASGAYYRYFDIARDKGDDWRNKFTRFNGELQEIYARHLMHVAYPNPERRGLIGVGKVYAPQTYVKRKQRFETSDIAIDHGLDLVLIEVTAGRLTEKSLVEADAESVVADLEKMIIKKIRQLGRVIADIYADPTRLPPIDLEHVHRIWPVIVSGDGLFQNPSMWAYTNKQAGDSLHFDRKRVRAAVQPVVLLDLEELEVMLGLIRQGISVIELLERKTTAPWWREQDFKAMVTSDFTHRWDEEVEFIREEWRRAARGVKREIGLKPPEPEDKQLHAA
jgi:hypothetical protein